MLYDHAAAARDIKAEEAYNELIKDLRCKETSLIATENYRPAVEHMCFIANKMAQQAKQIEEYQEFFTLMRKLITPNSNPHIKLG